MIDAQTARAYLAGAANRLPLRAALAYDPIRAIHGTRRAGRLTALGLVVETYSDPRHTRLTVMVAADDPAALGTLLDGVDWPANATWAGADPRALPVVEAFLQRRSDETRGQCYYCAETIDPAITAPACAIALDDVDGLDLGPCHLSRTALYNWLATGWRVFGAVRGGRLLAHALAAYPLGDTEEVAAVFTAPEARNQGLARAVAGAAAADIMARGHTPVYVAAKQNHASRHVAEALGMRPFLETWEIGR